MNSDWIFTKLENHVDLLTGFPFKSELFSQNVTDIPLVKGDNLHQKYIDWKNAKRWSVDDYEALSKFHLRKDDIVIAMDRPWIEAGLKYAWIKEHDPKSLLVQRVSRLRGINAIRTNYLRYVIGSPHFSLYLKNIVTGVNVPHISGKQILNFSFNLPDFPIQDKIISILSAYDDLIENNNKRIKLLEEMAEEIYKEWFVRLRFPGYKDCMFFDKDRKKVSSGTIGALPSGWENVRISNFGKVITGKTPSKNEESNFKGEIPFIKTPDMQQGMFFIRTEETLSLKGADSQKSQYVPKNSLSVSCIGTVGQIGIVTSLSQTNQQINSLVPNLNFELEYLYFSLLRLKPVIESYAATGATMANLSKSKFENLKIIKVQDILMKKFHMNVATSFEGIKVLMKKNQVLKETRDLLLPRLISGKLSVEEIEEAESINIAAELALNYNK